MNDKIAAWDDLAAFLLVAEHDGLSGAARASGGSAATLGRRVRALEVALARDLFVRRSHGYDLTEAGAALQTDLLPVQDRLARVLAPAADGGALPVVRIAAGTWTMWALTTRIARLAGDPPDVRLHLLAGEARVSMARREAAIAFRNARPTEAGLAGRRLRSVEFASYAKRSAPAGWIKVAADTPSALWVAEHAGTNIACEVSTPRLALDLALAGTGRALLPTFVGDAHGALVRTGEPIDALTHDSWLVTHDEDRHLPHVRRVLDRIEELDAG